MLGLSALARLPLGALDDERGVSGPMPVPDVLVSPRRRGDVLVNNRKS